MIALDERQALAALERDFEEWQKSMPENKAECAVQLDQWIVRLGEARWRMTFAMRRRKR